MFHSTSTSSSSFCCFVCARPSMCVFAFHVTGTCVPNKLVICRFDGIPIQIRAEKINKYRIPSGSSAVCDDDDDDDDGSSMRKAFRWYCFLPTVLYTTRHALTHTLILCNEKPKPSLMLSWPHLVLHILTYWYLVHISWRACRTHHQQKASSLSRLCQCTWKRVRGGGWWGWW